jgi:hypothetical protein
VTLRQCSRWRSLIAYATGAPSRRSCSRSVGPRDGSVNAAQRNRLPGGIRSPEAAVEIQVGINGMLIRPRAKTMAVSDGRRLGQLVARAPGRPCFAWSLVSQHTKVMTARISVECRRRAVEDSLSGAAGSASPTNLRRTGPRLKPDGTTRHPMGIAETRCTLGYVRAGGEAAEAEDHAGAVG